MNQHSHHHFYPSLKKLSYEYDPTSTEFLERASILIREEEIGELLKFSETYFEFYPNQKEIAHQLYNHLQLKHGYSSYCRELARIYVDASNKIRSIGVNKYGLPPMFDCYWALDRLGEMVDQAAYIHFTQQLKKELQKPVIYLGPGQKIANSAFIPYLKDIFSIISNPIERSSIDEISHFAPISTFFYKHSATQYGHNSTFFGSVYQELIDKNINPQAFKLKGITSDVAKKFLKNYGLTENDDFVVLHLRESGFITGDHHNNLRNITSLNAYVPAIKWLLSLGLKVVRIGHPKMTPLPKMRGLIDLTQKDRPPEVDIYLCAKAQFYYGSESGPVALARNFGTKILLSNTLCYGHNVPNTLFQLLPIYHIDTGRKLSVDQIEKLDLNMILSPEPYSKLGLQTRAVDSDSHVRSVREMLDFIRCGAICKANTEMKSRTGRQDLMSSFTSDTLDLYEG